ncbi:MAG: helix-turn-helix transcriptional regulator [Spirochaetes bacterium]|nr:helix-turn-helix transcriptional regulator [Spirochaetota bacterium]
MKRVNSPPEPGPVILALRRERRLTLDALAVAAGVSKAMLSQVEQGKANPTVATLWKIAGGLKVPVTRLLGAEIPTAKLSVRRSGELAQLPTGDGRCRITLLSPAAHVDRCELYRLAFAPGGSLASAPHVPGTEEVVTVLQGRLRCQSAGESSLLGPGDTAHYPADVRHSLTQEGKTPTEAVLTVVFSGRG